RPAVQPAGGARHDPGADHPRPGAGEPLQPGAAHGGRADRRVTALWRLAFRLARRELRGGIAGFRIFLACLALGVAAIAGIGSLAAAVVRGLEADARVILGGDAEFRLTHRPPGAEQREAIAAGGNVVSETVDFRGMARSEAGRQTLVEVKAVDTAYPLFGAVAATP